MLDYKYYPSFLNKYHALSYGGKVYLSEDGINWKELEINGTTSLSINKKINRDILLRKINNRISDAENKYNSMIEKLQRGNNMKKIFGKLYTKILLAIYFITLLIMIFLVKGNTTLLIVYLVPMAIMGTIIGCAYNDISDQQEYILNISSSIDRDIKEVKNAVEELSKDKGDE